MKRKICLYNILIICINAFIVKNGSIVKMCKTTIYDEFICLLYNCIYFLASQRCLYYSDISQVYEDSIIKHPLPFETSMLHIPNSLVDVSLNLIKCDFSLKLISFLGTVSL